MNNFPIDLLISSYLQHQDHLPFLLFTSSIIFSLHSSLMMFHIFFSIFWLLELDSLDPIDLVSSVERWNFHKFHDIFTSTRIWCLAKHNAWNLVRLCERARDDVVESINVGLFDCSCWVDMISTFAIIWLPSHGDTRTFLSPPAGCYRRQHSNTE